MKEKHHFCLWAKKLGKLYECSFENINRKIDTGNFLGEFVRLLLKTEQHTNLLQEDKWGFFASPPTELFKWFKYFKFVFSYILHPCSVPQVQSSFFKKLRLETWQRLNKWSMKTKYIDKVFDTRNKKWGLWVGANVLENPSLTSYEYHSAFTQYQTMANILESL